MTERILLIDIGNSCTTLAVAGRGGRGMPRGMIRLPTWNVTVASGLRAVRRLRGAQPLDGVMAASVAPSVNAVWSRIAHRLGDVPLAWIRHARPWNFRLCYPHPETLGADRLVNLCAAAHRYRPPLLVADFGTALTLDGLDARGEFHGGMIAPGFKMLADAPAQRTALLPVVVDRIGRMPVRTAGRSTREALRIGLLLGYRGLVRELITAAMRPLGAGVTLCVTGGYAAPVMAALPDLPCRMHSRLTLEGLGIAYALGRGYRTATVRKT